MYMLPIEGREVMEFRELDYLNHRVRQIQEKAIESGGDLYKLSKDKIQELNKLYLDEDYETYYVEYTGNIKEAIDKLDYAKIFFPGKFFAVVLVRYGMLARLVQEVKEITNIIKFFPFTLSQLKPSDFPHDPKVINKGSIDLNGEGVVVGIISTGIDYLNKNFITSGGKSRVVTIWDQTLDQGPIPYGFVQGTEFKVEEINRAIEEQRLGRNPYDIVNHRDEVGHGTAIAGIIGGRSNENPEELVSVAPTCEFAIVKIREAKRRTLETIGLENPREKVYGSYNIASAIRYLSDLQLRLNKPMVIYVPVGSNLGGHDGGTIIERYIDLFSQRRTLAFVGDSGNQGNTGTHASGQLNRSGDKKNIEINVANEEKNLEVSLYIIRADKLKIGITSPTGEQLENISLPNNLGEVASANLGGSSISVEYYPESQGIPDGRLDILIRNITCGTWNLSLTGEFITNGRYDAWLYQKELLAAGTRFINSDSFTTMMTPSTAINIITTASFNQQTGKILEESGRGYTRDGRIKPSVATGCVDVLTTGLDNKLIVASGPAMAGGILTGAVALLLQWALVQGNNPEMYPQRPRNYIVGGTIKQQNVVYPTPELGYGQLDIETLFKNLVESSVRNSTKEEKKIITEKDITVLGLYVNVPKEIYKKLKIN